MKKRRNKIVAIMMALSMVSLEVPVVSMAAESNGGYAIENTILKLTGSPEKEDGKEAKPTKTPQERPEKGEVTKPTKTPQERPEKGEVTKPTKTPQERPEEGEVTKPTKTPQERPKKEDEITQETYETSTEIKKDSAKKLTLKWNEVEGADGYEVYRTTSKKGNYKKVKTIKNSETTSYVNGKLKYGSTYYYVVKAYKNGEDGKNYLCESTTISEKIVPDTGKITSAKTKNNKVTLKWKKVSDASGYEVYRATGKNGKYTKVKTIKGAGNTSYLNKNLKDNTKYSYKIRAYKVVDGKKVYGTYSTIKTIKVKSDV